MVTSIMTKGRRPDRATERRIGWIVVVMLSCASVLNYMDRTALAVVSPQLRREFSLSASDYGLAVNCFLLAYMVFYTVGGKLADRIGPRRGFLFSLVWWSVAKMLHAASTGLRSLCAYRVLLGIGEGCFYPTALRGVTDWFGVADRAKGIGLYLGGASLGALLAPPLVAWITLRSGWRAAFLVTGGLGFLLVPPWIWIYRRAKTLYGQSDPTPGRLTPSEGPAGDELTLVQLARLRTSWSLLVARAATDSIWYFYLFWLPDYFAQVRGFSVAEIGYYLWLPYLCADLGGITGGWASSGLIRRGVSLNWARKSLLVPSAILAGLGTATYFAANSATAVLFVSAACWGHMSWGANLHATITDVMPPGRVATVYGITGSAGSLFGAAFQLLVGYLVDHASYAAVFVIAGSTYPLAAALLMWGVPRIEPLTGARGKSAR